MGIESYLFLGIFIFILYRLRNFLSGLGELAKLYWKGSYYFIDNLGPEAQRSGDGVFYKTLLPEVQLFGWTIIPTFSVGMINGHYHEQIVELMQNHDPLFRMPLDIFKHLMPDYETNQTDAHFFIHSTPESLRDRNRSIIPYIHNSERLEKLYDYCETNFEKVFSQWTTYQSLDYNLSKVVFEGVNKIFSGLENMNFDHVYQMNKIVEHALNNGRPCSPLFYRLPECLKFLMPGQNLIYKASKVYADTSRELLGMNKESIFATDNYSRYIITQLSQVHGGKAEDYITHSNVFVSSPLLYLGLNNIIGSLANMIIHLYSSNSQLIERLRKEVQTLDPKNLKEAQTSKFLEWAYLEALRLMRPVGYFPRFLSKATPYGDQMLPKNLLFVLCPNNTLTNPNIWGPDVETFRPERFKDMNIEAKNPKKYPFNQFGLGPRSCPGYAIAYVIALSFFSAFFKTSQSFVLDAQNPPINLLNYKSATNRMPTEYRAKIVQK